MTTVALKKPITAHGEDVTVLTFKEPTGQEIIECGYPMRIADGGVIPETGSIAKYISKLASVPPSSVRQLGPDDFNACMSAVLGFFGEGEEAEKTS